VSEDVLNAILAEVRRLADAAERMAGPAPSPILWDAADCFVWNAERHSLTPVAGTTL